MPRTFEVSHIETIMVFVGHHLLAEFLFFFFFVCVKIIVCLLTQIPCTCINQIPFMLRLNTTHVKSVSFRIMTEMELYWCNTWDKLLSRGQITSEIFDFSSMFFFFFSTVCHGSNTTDLTFQWPSVFRLCRYCSPLCLFSLSVRDGCTDLAKLWIRQ